MSDNQAVNALPEPNAGDAAPDKTEGPRLPADVAALMAAHDGNTAPDGAAAEGVVPENKPAEETSDDDAPLDAIATEDAGSMAEAADAGADDAPALEPAPVNDNAQRDGAHYWRDTAAWRFVSFVAIWSGLLVASSSIAYVLFSADKSSGAGLVLLAGVGLLAAAFLVGGALKLFSPLLLTGAMLRQAQGNAPDDAAQLAGSEILSALHLAEKVLDTDSDARLITRRDGVVTYANRAYQELSRDAGVMGPAGLPPRIDRLFAQHGAEATKLFRLCRAAKSGAAAEETLYQLMGLDGGGKRRRFEVILRPIRGADDHMAWRLREMPVEEEEHDALAAAYADFVEPVLAIEKSGQIAWANAAMREKLGASRGALRHIDDVVLGESAPVVSALWRVDQAPVEARVRRRFGDPADAVFKAFRRGGVGEGFVCVFVDIDEAATAEPEVSVSGDMTEAPFGVAVIEGEIGRDARIVKANKAFTDVFGGSKKNAPLARSVAQTALDDLAAEIKRKANAGGAPRAVEAVIKGENNDGPARYFALFARPVRRRRGSYGVKRTLLYSVETTERKRMEEDYAQDQKLKAIGHLAGEVAHDFNNLLQVVMGNCEHLMLRHPAGDPAYQELVLIRENAQRAANMTKQLLAYSRKQTLTRKVQSITEILLDFSRFLDRAVGEKVKIDLVNGRGLPPVKVDRNQLETAIMNLAVNARDAMAPDGGKLTISTRHITAEDVKAAAVSGLDAQDCVLIEVKDTGPGVPPEIAAQIFDPFFTTKAEGKGTGLGLSTVHGVIGQMGGAIALDSDEGKGATFRIYLPASEGEIEHDDEAAATARETAAADYTGSGRILVVEDEDPVRAFVVATLERSGYEVIAAEDGVDALDLLEEDKSEFDLVISDVMMPEIDGPTLVERARAEWGLAASVIFMSGYAEAAVRDQLDKIDGAGYLQKPFPMAALGAKVKDALAARAENAH
ncbi:MAG: ATP-binding protein [Pseudomonadota bacterium]